MPGLGQWLLAPLHAAAVATSAKSFRDNPIIGSPALNRMGLHVARRKLATRLGEYRRSRLAGLLTAAQREAFQRDGFLQIPNFLPQAEFEAMRAEIMALKAPARELIDGYTLTRLFPLDAVTLPGLPATSRALADPRYAGLHAYIGAYRRHPRICVQTIFSKFREGVPDVQSYYHADTFQPTVKSWLYLTEVEEDDAAFTYIPGSHRPNKRQLAWERRVSITARDAGDRLTAEGSIRITEEELRRLGYPAPLKLTAAPNTLVIADTSGFHRRGLSNTAACRIAIWAYMRSNPFVPWAGNPFMDVPALRGRGVRAFWDLQDALRRATGKTKTSGWRSVGPRSPATPPA
jgi:hypothetical protein